MFRKLMRRLLPNPFDRLLKKAKLENKRKFLLVWNRGLGDIPLGLYATKTKIQEYIPDAEITFLVRNSLKEGFLLLEGVEFIVAPEMRRGVDLDLIKTLDSLNISPKKFDLIIEKPDPTYWVRWQLGKLVPKLQWNVNYDELYKKFNLAENYTYIGVQTSANSGHSPWRDWPKKRWQELFKTIEMHPHMKVLLFGFPCKDLFPSASVIDLRGKTTVIEMLALIKKHCSYLILPDGGILSLIYFLDVSFPIKVISLWNDCQGVLKQKVASPNPQLTHIPLITKNSLSNIYADQVLMHVFAEQKLNQPL